MTTPPFKPNKVYRVETGSVSLDLSCPTCDNNRAFAARVTGTVPVDDMVSIINSFNATQHEPAFAHQQPDAFLFIGDLTCHHTKPDLTVPRTADPTPAPDADYPKFPVRIPAHLLPPLADFALTDGAGVIDATVNVQANITRQQFQTLMGDEANLVRHISLPTQGPDNWDICVRVQDVLACENKESMQLALIYAILEQDRGPRFTEQDMIRRARDWTDISEEAALFLVQMYAQATSPEMMVPDEELSRMQQQGLTLEDFMTPE